ncbi:MAG: DNA repair protein RadA, partial [Chloroflexota bacterium]|nr:DNA repair protein RadA [Chloroflexota bacterium]
TTDNFRRLTVPLNEFSRVLGGGVVPGSLVLIGGDPGIGKSTLLLQVANLVAEGTGPTLYVSGEESPQQVKMRADRLGASSKLLYILAETNLELVLDHIGRMIPSLVVIDSIQSVYSDNLTGAAGSVGQLRECTVRLQRLAKATNVPIFLVGHVTKEGAIAGPRVLEHIVDAVLYLEGERFQSFRLLRGQKNRFGSTNEIGIFEMRGEGMVEVTNPSQLVFAERPANTSGSVIACTLQGTRPLLVEIQALTSPTSFTLPRRMANGVDFNRLLMLVAVIGKRLGTSLSTQDVIVSVTGGIKIEEPAADLGIVVAIASSFKDLSARPDVAVFGEVGLSGEVRSVHQSDRRVGEAARLGLKRCVLPAGNVARARREVGAEIELVGVHNVREAVECALVRA